MDGWCPFVNTQGRKLLEKHWRELTPRGVKDLSFKWIKMFTTVFGCAIDADVLVFVESRLYPHQLHCCRACTCFCFCVLSLSSDPITFSVAKVFNLDFYDYFARFYKFLSTLNTPQEFCLPCVFLPEKIIHAVSISIPKQTEITNQIRNRVFRRTISSNGFQLRLSLGAPGCISRLHVTNNGAHTWYTQIEGRRLFLLFAPQEASNLAEDQLLKKDLRGRTCTSQNWASFLEENVIILKQCTNMWCLVLQGHSFYTMIPWNGGFLLIQRITYSASTFQFQCLNRVSWGVS